MLGGDGASNMAFFSSGSRALVEILTRMQSAERPMPVDHTFFEFGSIRYHVEASASDPENVYLSIATPSLSHEASSSSSGLPEATLQETRKAYHRFAEVVEPPREGYVLTLKLNFSGLNRPKDRVKAINQVSLLQSVVLSSQLRDMLGSLGPSGTMRLVYNQRDPFFVSKTAERINAVFPMRFRDDTDLAIATSFFQAYVKYHIKCTRRHIQSRMRERLEALTEVIHDARLRGNDDKRKSQAVAKKRRNNKRRLISFAKASKRLQKGFRAVLDKIKRLRLRIRVRGLDRLRRQCRCFAVPKLPPRRKEHGYHKLTEQ